MAEALESENWQVAVACDVRLGELFGNGGVYEGYSVEVDPEAVKAGLALIGPVGRGEILFEAVHDDSLPLNAVGCAKPVNQEGRVTSHVQVTIGGGVQAALLDPSIKSRIDRRIAAAGWLERNTIIGQRRIHRFIGKVAQNERAIHDQNMVHTTAMHELQHAVDHQAATSFKRIQRSMSRQALIREYTQRIDLPAKGTAALFAFEALRSNLEQPPAIGILGAAAVWGTTGHIYRKLVTRLNRFAYQYSWSEVRARRSEAEASRLAEPMIFFSRTNQTNYEH